MNQYHIMIQRKIERECEDDYIAYLLQSENEVTHDERYYRLRCVIERLDSFFSPHYYYHTLSQGAFFYFSLYYFLVLFLKYPIISRCLLYLLCAALLLSIQSIHMSS